MVFTKITLGGIKEENWRKFTENKVTTSPTLTYFSNIVDNRRSKGEKRKEEGGEGEEWLEKNLQGSNKKEGVKVRIFTSVTTAMETDQ